VQSLLLAFCFLLSGDPPRDLELRERHPLAPSLPVLTKEEEAHIQRVIDRFIRHEMGKLGGAEGKKALADLKALGPEAIPGLVHGLNRAANLAGSCPAVVLAHRLELLLSASEDRQLLDFVKDNVGLGVTVKRHLRALQELRLTCTLRKSYLVRNNIVYRPPVSPLKTMTATELAAAAEKERGPRQQAYLKELAKREGGKELILKQLLRAGDDEVKEQLKSDEAKVRLQAVDQVAARKLRYGAELIRLLSDGDEEVRRAAHRALVQMAGGQDFGSTEVARWRSWWEKEQRP
jgi:hypothetical protein